MNQIKSAIFPALLEPAKKAAQTVIDELCTECEVLGQEGFWVALKSVASDKSITHSFEYEGKQFVIFEKTAD